MPTLKEERLFSNDEFGRTRPGAKMYFYEAGTTTPKNTYTDVELQNTNEWPLIADGAGVWPQAFLGSGGYRIVYTDQNDVQFDERDNINIAETTILSTSDFYFENLADAKLGVAINGLPVDLQVGQIVSTAGKVTSTDGLGAEWIVVAAGTGTADDDLYADLDNGFQIKKIRNQVPWTLNSYTASGTDVIALVRKAENPINTSYAESQQYLWVASGTNTGAVTVAVDGLAAKDLKHPDGSALVAGDIVIGQALMATYDGTNMVLVSGYSRSESDSKFQVIMPDVAGFVASTTEYLIADVSSSPSFDIDSTIPENTWESIGPTGSGADNIWTALDVVPLDAKYIKLIIQGSVEATNATAPTGIAPEASIFARTPGSSASSNSLSKIYNIYVKAYANSSDVGIGSAVEVTIPVINGVFEANWDRGLLTTTSDMDLFLRGFGV